MAANSAVRVYVPATWDSLAALADLTPAAQIPTGGRGFAVTHPVREADPDGDDEVWEFAAFCDAADASRTMLGGAVRPRRVVLSLDLDAGLVHPVGDSSAVELPALAPATALVAVHVDGEGAEAAVSSVLAGAPVDALDDVALEWYLPGEVADLLG